ncbi:MAG: thrombospondin type 3 repeat-containing protein [Deltaproteobacteria bacterium]|nr:thrombospondin type 3 repeat-containing protein [Deltaproteobacteria bacterium]
MANRLIVCVWVLVAGVASTRTASAAAPRGQAIIQYFNTSWAEVTARMPEIAAAGYDAVWLPPATKGAEGVVDIGFSVYDRFDLGNRDQRGTVRTRYGTMEEAIGLVREAHRLGLLVYFDTVMNHNANPAKIENPGVTLPIVPMDGFPGTGPLDYHVLPGRDVGGGNYEVKNPAIFGGNVYTLAPNTGEREEIVPSIAMPSGVSVPGFTHLVRAPWIDFGNAGVNEELHLSLLGLYDFAIEQQVTPTGPASNDGVNLVSELPLPRYVRNPDRPETYPDNTPVAEDVREYLIRWIKWFGQTTDCDGLRLDAIKHVPPQFFGVDFPSDPIAFNQAFQDNLDQRRGSTDEVDDDGFEDGLLFGESFTGDFGSLLMYRRTGMYLLDFPLLFKMAHDGGVFARSGDGDLGQLSYPQGGMDGADTEFGGLGRTAGVAFVQSHDTNAPGAQPNGAYAFVMTRAGHGVVFFDGNNHDSTTFVKPGREDALGELGSTVITNLLSIRRRFARGGMFNRFVDGDTYVYERVVATPSGRNGATLLVALTDNTGAEARFGEFDPRPLLVTEFAPGTILREQTGNGSVADVTVLDPNAIPAAARDRALAEYDRSSDFPVPQNYGLLYLQIPAGPEIGYVAYAPRTPPMSVRLTVGGAEPGAIEVVTAPVRRTPSGARVPEAKIEALQVPGLLDISVISDATAVKAYAKIDGGASLPGVTLLSATSGGLYDAFIELGSVAGGFERRGLDVSSLPPGVHVLTVRVAGSGEPSFFSEEIFSFVVGGTLPTDAGVADGSRGDGALPDAGEGDAGTDAGIEDNDPDRDGIPTGSDVCPNRSDPIQSDFDGDRVGDACDVCPMTRSGSVVDGEGCVPVDEVTRSALDAIVEAILDERFDSALDSNSDGRVSVLDFVQRGNAR